MSTGGSGDASGKDLKAGHPPAVKAGGMRITQAPKLPAAEKEKMTPEEEEEYGEASKSPPKDVQLLISGATTKGNKDFPKEAIQSYQNKPLPIHQKHVDTKPHHHVQQPKKL